MISKYFIILDWKRSSYSGDNGNCVEVAMVADVQVVRDSKNTDGPALAFPASAWEGFIADLKR